LLVIDVQDIRERVSAFKKAFDWIKPGDIRFATKANKYGEVLSAVEQGGIGFEVASESEVRTLQRIGVDFTDVVFSNPGKHLNTARAALQAGVRMFVSDSRDDLETLRQAARETGVKPDKIEIILRLQQARAREEKVDSCGSHLGLPVEDTSKSYDAMRAAWQAQKFGFRVIGSTFNAGTNQLNIGHWQDFVAQAAQFAKKLKDRFNIDANVLDMGGAFPAITSEKVKDLDTYASSLRQFVEQAYQIEGLAFPRVIIEPGRGICHPAHLFGTVIGVKPDTQREGAFHAITTIGHSNSGLKVTLSNAVGDKVDEAGFGLQAFRLDPKEGLRTLPGNDTARFNLENLVTADVAKWADDVSLPRDLRKGDVIAVSGVGAYSDSFRGNWLQLPNPRVILYDRANPGYVRDISPDNPITLNTLAGIETIQSGVPCGTGRTDLPQLTRDLLGFIAQHEGLGDARGDDRTRRTMEKVWGMPPGELENATNLMSVATALQVLHYISRLDLEGQMELLK